MSMLIEHIIVLFYFAILFLIGYFASRRIANIEDYYAGGKKLNFWLVSFSSRATGESSWLLLGLTGMGAILGFKAFWVILGEVLGVGLAWFAMASAFKNLTDRYRSITIPDFLASHFKEHATVIRTIAAFVLSVFVIIYVSAQIDATGFAFANFLGWKDIFGAEAGYLLGAISGFVIVILYTFYGGFIAVVWSDLFQGLLMLAGLLLLPIMAFFLLSESASLSAIDPGLVNIWGSGGFSLENVLSSIALLAIGLGFLGSPQIFVRFIAIKNKEEIQKGRWVAIIYTLLATCGAVATGILGRLLLFPLSESSAETAGQIAFFAEKGEAILPLLSAHLLPVAMAGFYTAVVLSAIMSTVDSLMVVASSAVARDFYQKLLHPRLSDRALTKISRAATLLMAFLALTIALTIAVSTPNHTIFWFVIFGWSGIAATFCPLIILSLTYRRYNAKGAIASMISGFISVPFFKFVLPAWGRFGELFSLVEELLPSFCVSLLMGILVSALDNKLTARKEKKI